MASSREAAVLEERLEQLRSGKWADITSPAYLQAILANPPSSAAQLPSLTEEISEAFEGQLNVQLRSMGTPLLPQGASSAATDV